MGNNTSNTPSSSVPDREFPPNMPPFIGRNQGFEVAMSPQQSPPPSQMKRNVPCVFRWEEGGNQVLVSGDWDNFSTKKALVRTKSAHTIILELAPGQHRYRFEVDGRRAVDQSKPLSANVRGEQFNMMTAEVVGEFAVASNQGTEAHSPPGEYSQEVREPPANARAKRKGNPNDPPMLPPHLLRALLNTPPMQNPLLLPTPHHVMLNHLYINRGREQEGVAIFGVTCRVRTKFLTTVLYTRNI